MAKLRIRCSRFSDSQIEVDKDCTVKDFKALVRKRYSLAAIKEVMMIKHKDVDLEDDCFVSDLQLPPMSLVTVSFRTPEQAGFFVHSVFDRRVYEMKDINPFKMTIRMLKGVLTRRTGLPVAIFSLFTADRKEMFQSHFLSEYKIKEGNVIYMETLQGWTKFLSVAASGFTNAVMSEVTDEEYIADYQLKVALYIAAHYGHEALTHALLKLGIRSDEKVGDHPSRVWCSNSPGQHPDLLRAPIHVAVEARQMGILRTFVQHDLSVILAKDGHGLRPLNLALRNKYRQASLFLLTKQWAKLMFSKMTISLTTYRGFKRWGERAKLRVRDTNRSHMRKRGFPLIGIGLKISIDGFSNSYSSSSKIGPSTGPTAAAGDGASSSSPNNEYKRVDKLQPINTSSNLTTASVTNGSHLQQPALPAGGQSCDLTLSVIQEGDGEEEDQNDLHRDSAEYSRYQIYKIIDPPQSVMSNNLRLERSTTDISARTLSQYQLYKKTFFKSEAKKSLEIAQKFKYKSWLNQVYMGMSIAKHQVQRGNTSGTRVIA